MENQSLNTFENTSTKTSRRRFFKFGAGLAAGLTGVKAIADSCGIRTGAQPLGPFFPRPGTPSIGVYDNPDPNLPPHLRNDNDLTFVKGVRGKANGQIATIKGRVLDESCRPISGASIIIWQASASGRYNHRGDAQNFDFEHPITGKKITRQLDPSFQYWGRAVTNNNGEYIFKTVVPGFYPADLNSGWYRPPHIHFMISALGFNQLVTQMYFNSKAIPENDFIQDLNQKDFLLQSGSISNGQREKLLVNFTSKSSRVGSDLSGTFDITLRRG